MSQIGAQASHLIVQRIFAARRIRHCLAIVVAATIDQLKSVYKDEQENTAHVKRFHINAVDKCRERRSVLHLKLKMFVK